MTTNEPTIPVIVQTSVEEAAPLVDWPVRELDKVFDLVRAWGLVDSQGDQADLDSLCGDLVVHEGRVVFRLSIMDVG